jgi:hypothetical protein
MVIEPVLAQRDSRAKYVAENPEQSDVTGCATHRLVRQKMKAAANRNFFTVFLRIGNWTNSSLKYRGFTHVSIPEYKTGKSPDHRRDN